MNMEEIRGLNENFDNFPVGVRVLAVDDDAVCLKLLEAQLRKCQYQVTTSSQARTALKMLRENKDGFDLVISDVHMPDMDGFKLLEVVGLEMDVPVIMLSANDDPKLVLKGVTHGACDYLVKPVTHELLKNIWQHVIRRKKVQNKCTDEAKNQEVCESPPTIDSGDKNGKKLSRKRKDDAEDTGSEDEEDPATQKKARVVWSIELHKKFVAAVTQLGIEKAVPKRILDLMNEPGITRENVASHLQKYRIYLKKTSSFATQQANIRATLGLDGHSLLRTYSSDWLGDYRTPPGSGRLVNSTLSSPYATNGMLGRLNSTPANVNYLNLTPSPLIQPTRDQNMSRSITSLGKMQSPTQNSFIFQGNGNFTDNSRIFPSANAFRLNSAANKMMLHANIQQMLSGSEGFGNQLATSETESYNASVNGFSNLSDQHSQSPVNGLSETNSANGHYLQNNLPSLENGNEKSASEARARSVEHYPIELPKWQGGFVPQSYDSLDDLMSAVLKREQDGASLSSDFGFDDCSFEELFTMDPR